MILIANLAGLPSYHELSWAPDATGLVYINPLARIFEFTLGMGAGAIFLALRPRIAFGSPAWAGIEMAALSLLILNIAAIPGICRIGAAYGGAPTAEWLAHGAGFCLATAIFIISMALSRGPISKVLGCKFMVYFGEISFAVYMTHYIILSAYIKRAAWFSGWSGAQKLMLFIPLLLALSTALYECVEKPSRWLILRIYGAVSRGVEEFPSASAVT